MLRENNHGFALVVALSMMAFVLVLLLSLSLFVSVETTSAANSKQRLMAKENARLGLLVAIGNLQRYAGPDQRVTARAQIDASATANAEMWTGVWDANSGSAANPVWLVSGENPTPATGTAGTSPPTLYPSTPEFSGVQADWVPIENDQLLTNTEFAYWVEEQGVKARVNQADKTEAMDFLNGETEAIQDIRESLLLHPSQDYVFNALIPDSEPDDTLLGIERIELLGRAETASQIGFSFPEGIDVASNLRNQHHDYTAYSLGILENSIDGGLKTNLTGRTQDDIDNLLALSANAQDHYLKGDYLLHYNIDPDTGIPLPKNANQNSPNSSKSSLSSNGDFIRLPTADFYDFRDNATDPDDDEMEVVRNIMPVVSEVSFRLGAFHTQSDTKHRIRFHADVEFWNPYPFPIRFPGEGQNRSFVVMMVPSELGNSGRGRGGASAEQMILSIEKIGAGRGRGGGQVEEELHTNLFDFDEDLGSVLGGGSTNNTINETVITSWMVIDDAVIQPGEVYHATTERTVGLARELGGYILKAGGDPTAAKDYIPDPEHDYNKWSWHTVNNPSHPVLKADDQIRMSLRMPEDGITFRLIPFDSASQNQNPVYEEENNEWAKPVFELRNIYKVTDSNLLVDTLTPSEYSRSSSGSYTLDNYNIGFHFRLVDDFIVGTDASAANIGLGFDLRQPVWDYENPEVKRALMIGGIYPEDAEAGDEPSPFDAPDQLDLFFNGLDILADGTSDNHGGSYQRAFLYPRPDGEPLSVGSFRNLPLSSESVVTDIDGDGTDETVQEMAGMPWGGSLNESFDKYFYTGAPATDWTTDQPMPIPAELRSGATQQNMRQTNAAENMLIEGSFNVNSLSPRAWASMLSRTVQEWEYNGPSSKTELKNAFFNLSYSTDNAIEVLGTPSEESELTTSDPNDLSGSETLGRLAMRHPLRRPSDLLIYNPDTPADDSLVEFLIDELETYFESNPPFASVSEFIESGALANAIRRSGINGSIPVFSPAYITQAAMLEPIAPFLTVRSDTFIVRSAGHLQNQLTGETISTTFCEAVVQRIPDRVDDDSTRLMENATSNNNTFGRRFVIKDIRWIGDDT